MDQGIKNVRNLCDSQIYQVDVKFKKLKACQVCWGRPICENSTVFIAVNKRVRKCKMDTIKKNVA